MHFPNSIWSADTTEQLSIFLVQCLHYKGGPEFKSQSGDQVSWDFFFGFLSPSSQILGIAP
jgi:hypothetical protein